MQSNRDEFKARCKLQHDLYNKLGVILGYCSLLEDHKKEDGAERAKYLGRIREAAEQMVVELRHNSCRLTEVPLTREWPQNHVER